MRPGNYAHEKWPEISFQITGLKQRLNNKYYVNHWYNDAKQQRRVRIIILTKTQALLYNDIVNLPLDANGNYKLLELTSENFNSRSFEILINKQLFKFVDSNLKAI